MKGRGLPVSPTLWIMPDRLSLAKAYCHCLLSWATLITGRHRSVLWARAGEAGMLALYCGMIRRKDRGMVLPTSPGMSWLWPHRQYRGHWRFPLCRMALSLPGFLIACEVFEACRHGGIAYCVLSGVVQELSGPSVFGEVSFRQSQCIDLLLSNSCHDFAPHIQLFYCRAVTTGRRGG